MRTLQSYGVGARFEEVMHHRPLPSLEPFRNHTPYVDLTGEPGDLYLFNSEYLHELPPILGECSRAVLGAVTGFSADEAETVEVWG